MAVTVKHVFDAREERAVNRAVRRLQRYRLPMLVLGALCSAGGIVFALAGVRNRSPLASLVQDVLPWAMLGAFWISLALLSPDRMFGFWKREDRFRGPQMRSIDEDGFHVRAEGFAFDLPWHAMSRTVETPEFFLFFDSQHRAHHMPKAPMRESELREVHSLLGTRSVERRKLLGI